MFTMSENPVVDNFEHHFNRDGNRIGLYCSDVHYIRALLQYKFNKKFSLAETYEMLKEEYPDFNYRMETPSS